MSNDKSTTRTPQQGEKPDNSTDSRTLAADTSEGLVAENSTPLSGNLTGQPITEASLVGGEATPRVEPAQGEKAEAPENKSDMDLAWAMAHDICAKYNMSDIQTMGKVAGICLSHLLTANKHTSARLKECVEALEKLMRRLDDHFGGNPEQDWKEQADARTALENVRKP